MKSFSGQPHRPHSGFSLIEMMVATAIFIVIVTMIGAVFRQASSSWEAGYASAEGGAVIRGVIGTIQRELSTAVDGRAFPGVFDKDDPPVKISSSKLEFICLKTAPSEDKSVREPHLVTYNWTGGEMTRTDQGLTRNVGKWVKEGGGNKTILYTEGSDPVFSAEFTFHKTEDRSLFWTVPRVSIIGKLTRRGSFSGLEVRSYGRNGFPNDDTTKSKNDDIIAN